MNHDEAMRIADIAEKGFEMPRAERQALARAYKDVVRDALTPQDIATIGAAADLLDDDGNKYTAEMLRRIAARAATTREGE